MAVTTNFDKLVYDILNSFSNRAKRYLMEASDDSQMYFKFHELLVRSFRDLLSRKSAVYLGLPPTEEQFSTHFIKWFGEVATYHGANGLDIVEMLEFLREEYEQVRTSQIQ